MTRNRREQILKEVFSGERYNSFEIIMGLNAEKMDEEERNMIQSKI